MVENRGTDIVQAIDSCQNLVATLQKSCAGLQDESHFWQGDGSELLSRRVRCRSHAIFLHCRLILQIPMPCR